MVTYAQAQERAEEWVNGEVPAYQHREVRVREFGLGFVVWAEDREGGPVSGAGRQRLVIARDGGEVTLWPGLPVGEVIRRYEEQYGAPAGAGVPEPAEAPERIDLNQTSFLLTPPEWLQDAADRMGVPDRRGTGGTDGAGGVGGPGAGEEASAPAGPAGAAEAVRPVGPEDAVPGPGSASVPVPSDAVPAPGPGPGPSDEVPAPGRSDAVPVPVDAVPGAVSWPAPEADRDAAGREAAPPAPVEDVVDAVPAGEGGAGTGSSGTLAPVPPASASSATPTPTPAPWSDVHAPGAEDDGSAGLPATVFAPPLSGSDDDDTPPPAVGADAPTALMSGGSQLPRTAVTPLPVAGDGPGTGDIADAATSKATRPPRLSRGTGSTTPPPPGEPGVPGARSGQTSQTGQTHSPSGSGPGAPGAPAGGYVPTQLVSQLGPDGPVPAAPPGSTPPPPPGPPGPPGATPPPGADVHYAQTMLSQPGPGTLGGPPAPSGATLPPPPGAPAPPGSTPGGGVHYAQTMLSQPGPVAGPGAPGAPQPPGAPGVPGAPGGPGTPPGGVHHAATMLAQPGPGGPAAPGPVPPPQGAPVPVPPPHAAPGPVPPHGAPGQAPPPGAPGAYGYPQPPAGLPTVGPGYQAVLRYRAHDGSEAQLIRRSAPGMPHPEWQILHELRAMNVPPQAVLELHTELESCDLPGGYCARMIRETWPQARITSIAPYGRDHASRQQGMGQLIAHQGELHQVADGPARPAPVRAPLPAVQPVPPVPPEAVAQELAGAFGPGICRFDQRAVSRQGVPELVARTLVWAGLPADFGPFFWAQPAHPVVPTLAELAAQRQVRPAADAGSYLVVGSDFGRAICVQYGTANIVAVPVEAGPDGRPQAPQFVNSGLPELVRCLALLGRMWRLRFGLTPEQAGRWTVDFQAQLAMLDPAALASPESWWSVLLEQMWDGLL
ncbi:SUKH-4 family immunity protein [Streptomyces sp. NPDC046887]|uniref:SUKH-4 family immunity protein n=1 Tax=Streptomyces sp. NPDC046887 TaxID=3155472 RepID=UPI0033D2E180